MPPRAQAAKEETPPPPELAAVIEDVLGHELIRNLLAGLLAEDRLPQTLLFHGPPLVGKRTMAVCLAKRLLSPAPGGASPLSCAESTGRRISRNRHLDFRYVRPEGGRGSKVVRIDQIRELQDWAWISPAEGERKAAIVGGADTITEEAANSLLKLLEEPPSRLTVILVSDAPHRLLETVRSRCAPLAFHPAPKRLLEEWLIRRRGVEAGQARLIASLAEGRPGRALEMLTPGRLASREPLLRELELLRRHGFLALPAVSARCLRHAGGLQPALEGLLLLLRDALALRIGSGGPNQAPAGASEPAEGAGEHEVPPRSPRPARPAALEADLEGPLRLALADLPPAVLLAAAEAAAQGLELTRHLYIPSETLILENVLADAGMAMRRRN